MVFTRSKLNKLSKEELIEELESFDNLSEKINDLTTKMDDFTAKFDLSCRFPEPAIHYYTNELLIWSNHLWTMLNI